MRKILSMVMIFMMGFMPVIFGAEGIVVKDPWVRWLPGGRPNSAAFMVIENHAQTEAVLRSVSSSKIQSIEMHTMESTDGMMRMRRVEEIRIPAGGQVELKPGVLHLMVFGLPEDFQDQDKMDLTLTFADGSSLTVEATARSPQ